jgi:hypothetical protein
VIDTLFASFNQTQAVSSTVTAYGLDNPDFAWLKQEENRLQAKMALLQYGCP